MWFLMEQDWKFDGKEGAWAMGFEKGQQRVKLVGGQFPRVYKS